MSTLGWVWTLSLVVALGMLPVGLLRMVAFRSGDAPQPPYLRGVAWLAIGIGAAAVLVFLVASVWLAVTGRRPV